MNSSAGGLDRTRSRRGFLRALGAVAGVSALGGLAGCSSPVTLSARRSRSYRSRPDLHPPGIVVDVRRRGTRPGLVVTDSHGAGQQGPIIIGNDGELVWFLPLSDDGTPDMRAFNVREQKYRGAPVLTWFEGAVVSGHGSGHYAIADSSYRRIATVSAQHGLQGDLHEFFLTDESTAVFSAYGTEVADLSRFGGPASRAYWYGAVQEVDVATGELLFEWRSDRHVGLDESYAKAPSDGLPWDYFHLNSIAIDPTDGHLVISGRNTWAIYKVHRATGEVMWRLGGKRTDFDVEAAARFAYQHNVTPHANGLYTMFDNEGAPWVAPPSRGLALEVDEPGRQVTLRQQYLHQPPVRSAALGSVQLLADDHVFIGWGQSPHFTEYDPDGRAVFDAHLVGRGIVTYRAFKKEWVGRPAGRPAVAVSSSSQGVELSVSWNGATEVDRWRLLGGDSSGALAALGTVPKLGFETQITAQNAPRFVALEGLDSSGEALGRSETVEV